MVAVPDMRDDMARPIRILFLIDKLGIGGTERQLIELTRRLERDKFELYLGCLDGAESGIPEYLPECVKVRSIILTVRSTYSLAALAAVYRLIRLIRSESIDIVQCYFLKAKFLGCLAGRLAGVKTVSCQRDLGMHINATNRAAVRLANACADRFLVNSLSIKECLIREQGVPSDRIDVVANGVDVKDYRSATPAERAAYKLKLGLDPATVVIGVVANLKPVKGLGDFIRAVALVSRAYEKSYFVIVGQGPQEDELKHLATELRVADKLFFAGRRDDVRPFLGAFDIAVLCSLSEGFSNAVLEYMAAGLPVVATRVGGNQEQVRDGETGFLVPPGDSESLAKALLRLIQDDGLRARMSQVALRECTELYTMEKMIGRMEDYYTRLAALTVGRP